MTTKITLAVTVLLACSLLTLSAAALDKASYEQLYLTAQDLPGLEKRADDTYGGPIPTTVTEAFEAVGGTFAGRVQWYHPHTDEVVWSVMDMRYVFPDERTAQSFIDDNAATLSEGMNPVARSPTVGEDSLLFGGNATYEIEGQQVDLRHFIMIFRAKNVVGKVYVAQGPTVGGDRLAPLTVASVAGRALRRMEAVVGPPGTTPPTAPPTAPPTEPPASTAGWVDLPVLGVTLKVSPAESWRVERAAHPQGEADGLARIEPREPPVELIVVMMKDTASCDALATSTQVERRPNDVWIEPVVPSGYYRRVLEHEGGKFSSLCAETKKGVLWVMTSPSMGHPDAGQVRPILAALVEAAGPAALVAPPPPSPAPAPPPPEEDDDWEGPDWDDFANPHFNAVRLQLNGVYIMPETEPSGDRRRRAFGLEGELDAGFVSHRLIGFSMDMGVALGYHFDANVPFDAHVGAGLGLGLGPVSINPVVGVGVDTRGAGDAVTHQMGAAFYWYPGGRLRVRIDEFAFEAQASRSFRGSIDTSVAERIHNLTKVTGRLIFIDEDDATFFAGFRWTRYDGATDDDGNFLYPSADQFGGLLGIGFSFADEMDE